jgi:hypothetical protein
MSIGLIHFRAKKIGARHSAIKVSGLSTSLAASSEWRKKSSPQGAFVASMLLNQGRSIKR